MSMCYHLVRTSTARVPLVLQLRSQGGSSMLSTKMNSAFQSNLLAKNSGHPVNSTLSNPHSQSRRFQSTYSFNDVGQSSDAVMIEEAANKFLTPLEFMTANSTLSSGAGTIFSDTVPVIWTSEFLCAMKDFMGMSWVQTILLGTIVIRLLIGIPIAVSQQKALAKLEDLQPRFKQLATDLKGETGLAIRKFGWDEPTAKRQFMKSYKKHWRTIVEEENCHPMKSLCLGLLQIPAWICFSSAIRNLVYGLPAPTTNDQAIRWAQFHSESLPWVDSLTLCDPVVFPVVFLAANLTNIRLNRMLKKSGQQQSKLQKSLPWVFGAGIVAISFLACFVPSAVSMYWAISSSTALVQNVIMKRTPVRRILGLKPM